EPERDRRRRVRVVRLGPCEEDAQEAEDREEQRARGEPRHREESRKGTPRGLGAHEVRHVSPLRMWSWWSRRWRLLPLMMKYVIPVHRSIAASPIRPIQYARRKIPISGFWVGLTPPTIMFPAIPGAWGMQ